ncbi:MAG: acyltransferase [Gemmatimonadota bacterium]
MPNLPLRPVPLPPETEAAYDRWLGSIDARLEDPACDRYALCREVLTEVYGPWLRGTDGTSGATEVLALQLDARNVTLEPEYYDETDLERYDRVKPLIWLWEMFDRSPLGENVHLGIKLRRLLARRIFKRCGTNFKAFHQVKLSFGYNLEVGDNVVVHREVLLDDRGGIVLGDKVSLSDFVNVYSHSHALDDPRDVTLAPTVIERGVRVAYHATVLAGVRMHEYSMAGAGALITKDVPADTLVVGVPAHPLRDKGGRPRPGGRPDPLATE